MMAELFLDALFGQTEHNVNIRAIHPGKPPREAFVRGTEEILRFGREHADGYNVYFAYATRNGGGKKEHIREVVGLHADVDFKATPRKDAEARLASFHLSPTFVVETGGGFHVYWLLREPGGPEDIPRVEAINRGLAKALGGDLSACDASRVLRVPGTWNRKPEYGDPRAVRVIEAHPERRYDLGDFAAYAKEDPPKTAVPGAEEIDLDLVKSALSHLDASDREEWREAGMALKYHALRGDVADDEAYRIWDAWSQTTTAGNYDARDQALHWERDFDRIEGKVVTVGTIFKRAHDRGWERPTVILKTDEPAYVARRYAEAHGDVWHWRGDFYQWTGAWWRPVSEDDLNARLWTWLEHARLRKRDEKGRRYRPDKTKVNHVLAALSGVCHQEDVREAPFWIEPRDGDPRPVDLLPFHNGVLDLRTLTLRGPDPRLFALHRCDCVYDPTATAPRWNRFMCDIFPDDEPSARSVEEILGYCLTSDTSQQKAFLLQGVKRSGKGTVLRVLRRLVGPDRWTAPTITQFSHSDFGMQPLIGKAVAAISDARGQDARNPHVVTERILTVTGEDAVSVNRKNKPFWEGVLPTRILYVSNVPPKMHDPSGVIVSRFVAIHFQVSFEDREDTNLTDKLLAELPGIVNRALAGLTRLRERGRFEQPETGKVLLAVMDELTGPVRAFVDEMCEVGPGPEVHSQRLYDAFCDWCEANGHRRMASSTFGRDLFALGKGITKGRAKVRHPETGELVNGPPVYRGVALIESQVPF